MLGLVLDGIGRSSLPGLLATLNDDGTQTPLPRSQCTGVSVARGGKLETLKDFLQNGADVNASDYDGRTALHLAASEGNGPCVEMLLAAGARFDLPDRWGNNAKQEAERSKHPHLLPLFKGQGAAPVIEVSASPAVQIDARRASK